jgi:hypothetical protein
MLLTRYMPPTNLNILSIHPSLYLPLPLPHLLPHLHLPSKIAPLLPRSFLFPTTPSLLPRITHNPSHLALHTLPQMMIPFSTFPISTFLETPHLLQSCLPLVRTSQMLFLALSLRLHKWLSSFVHLFLRYVMLAWSCAAFLFRFPITHKKFFSPSITYPPACASLRHPTSQSSLALLAPQVYLS